MPVQAHRWSSSPLYRLAPDDGALERLKFRARLDAQLRDDLPATLSIHGERFGAPPRPVEREHETTSQAFVERVCADDHPQIANHLLGAIEGKLDMRVLLKNHHPSFI